MHIHYARNVRFNVTFRYVLILEEAVVALSISVPALLKYEVDSHTRQVTLTRRENLDWLTSLLAGGNESLCSHILRNVPVFPPPHWVFSTPSLFTASHISGSDLKLFLYVFL